MSETEWDVIQKKLGPTRDQQKPKVIRTTEENIAQLAVSSAEAHTSTTEGNEFDDEEEKEAFEEYRRKRMAEMRQTCAFGTLVEVNSQSFISEITESSKKNWVVVELSGTNETSELLKAIFITLARKFREVKFAHGKASNCMAKPPPNQSLPFFIVYKNGVVVNQELGIEKFGGLKTTPDDIEWELARLGIIKTELSEPPSTTIQGRYVVNIAKKAPQVSSA